MTENRWFDARLSIGNLITIGTVAIAVVAGWFQFGNRVNLFEEQMRRQDVALERLDRERDDLKTRVIRIEEKISGQGETLQRILRTVESRDWRPEGQR